MIEKIEIDGYRLLHGFKADLKPLNVVVGANATGKSSLIDWLQLMSYCCRVPISSAFGQFDASEKDVVAGLPDLYPTAGYA